MSEVEMETAEASADAPVTDTDYTAEMGQTYDEVNSLGDHLAKTIHESELTKYSDHSDNDEPTEPTETPDQPTDRIQAPQSWNASARQHWNTLPREMQEYIGQREQEAQQKITEQGRQLYELHQAPLASMPHLEHVERVARETGLTTDATLQHWAAADELLKSNPAAAIQYLAQAHGVDLGTVGNSAPQVEQLHHHYAQQVAQLRNEQAQRQQQQERHLTAAISRFADGKPYWAQVEPLILQQIHAMKMTDPGRVEADPLGALQEAEKQALTLTGIEDPARQAAAKKKADEAKRLASLNVRSSVGSPKPSYRTMEEEMLVTYERLNGRY